jgi:hypothetical protein
MFAFGDAMLKLNHDHEYEHRTPASWTSVNIAMALVAVAFVFAIVRAPQYFFVFLLVSAARGWLSRLLGELTVRRASMWASSDSLWR